MRKRYRAAIVGLSWIATDPAAPASHPVLGTAVPYSHASAFATVPDIEVIAGCDIDFGARERFQDRWGHVWPTLHLYEDYREMLRHEQIDILSVATPDHLHTEVVLAGVMAGIRAIFCEKPLATSLTDADAMVAATRQRGVVTNVNHTRRWLPSYVAAREQVRKGAIGPLAQVIVHCGGPRAMLFRNHSHALDLMCYFAESEPEWIVGELESGFEDYGTEYQGDGGHDPATEPGANAYIAFRNGVRAFLSGMKRTSPELCIELIGETGRIQANDSVATRTFTNQDEAGTTQQVLIPRSTVAGMQAAVFDLIRALETGTSPESPAEEARKTVAVITAILESQANGTVPVQYRRATSRG